MAKTRPTPVELAKATVLGTFDQPTPQFVADVDALIAAVRAEYAPPTIEQELDKLKTVMGALRQSGIMR